MKNLFLIQIFIFILIATVLTSCDFVGDLFEASVRIAINGLKIVVLVIVFFLAHQTIDQLAYFIRYFWKKPIRFFAVNALGLTLTPALQRTIRSQWQV